MFGIEMQQLMAGSGLTFTSDGQSGEGTLNPEEAEGDALTRRRSVWDDED